MMAWGDFVFSVQDLSFQELARKRDWRFAESERLGARKAAQFTGSGDDNITLSGVIYPGQFGKAASLEVLATKANNGTSHQLVAGSGDVLGQFALKSLSNTNSVLFIDGAARKIDFTAEFGRVD